MHKIPFTYLFLLIGTGLLLSGCMSGYREYDDYPMGRQDYTLGTREKSFMIYKGTETLIFIDIMHNRDTIRFKGTGIETGIDTSFIRTNENIDYPCIDTVLFEHKRIRFINQANNHDDMTIKISGAVHDNIIVKCLSVKRPGSIYYLRYTSIETDSMRIDGKMYHKLYPLYENLNRSGNKIFFNQEFGLLTHKDEYQSLVLISSHSLSPIPLPTMNRLKPFFLYHPADRYPPIYPGKHIQPNREIWRKQQ